MINSITAEKIHLKGIMKYEDVKPKVRSVLYSASVECCGIVQAPNGGKVLTSFLISAFLNIT